MLPRPVLPGKTYLITRRCIFRRHYLLPRPIINAIILYCLLEAAKRYGIVLHAFCILSNHLHIVATDPHANLPAFMERMIGLIARCLNAYYGRKENIWATGSYSRVLLEGPLDILAKIVYVLANPVASRLVPTAKEWPGLWSGTLRKGVRKLKASRPKFYFSENSKLPEEIEYEVRLPEELVELQGALEGTLLHDAYMEREGKLQEEALRENRKFLGVNRILRMKPEHSPRSEEPRGALNPRLAAKAPKLRKKMIARLKAFLAAYREAYRKFREGVKDVVFPAGTYWLRVHLGVRCADPPLA
jgi:REP element-mobilizing transposase RayT